MMIWRPSLRSRLVSSWNFSSFSFLLTKREGSDFLVVSLSYRVLRVVIFHWVSTVKGWGLDGNLVDSILEGDLDCLQRSVVFPQSIVVVFSNEPSGDYYSPVHYTRRDGPGMRREVLLCDPLISTPEKNGCDSLWPRTLVTVNLMVTLIFGSGSPEKQSRTDSERKEYPVFIYMDLEFNNTVKRQ